MFSVGCQRCVNTERSCGKGIQTKQCQCCGSPVKFELKWLGSLLVLLISGGIERCGLYVAEKRFNPSLATYSMNLGLCVCCQFPQHLNPKTLKASIRSFHCFSASLKVTFCNT